MGFYFNTHSSHDRPIGKTQRTLKAIYVMGFVGGFVKEKKSLEKGWGWGEKIWDSSKRLIMAENGLARGLI